MFHLLYNFLTEMKVCSISKGNNKNAPLKKLTLKCSKVHWVDNESYEKLISSTNIYSFRKFQRKSCNITMESSKSILYKYVV